MVKRSLTVVPDSLTDTLPIGPMYPFNLLSLDLYFNESQLLILVILSVPVLYYLYLVPEKRPENSTTTTSNEKEAEDEQPKTVMQPENPELAPPRDDPFTAEQLKEFDGSDESKPIYVAIKRSLVPWRSSGRNKRDGV